jgi:hypothetical protein
MSNDRKLDRDQFNFWVSGFKSRQDAMVALSAGSGIGFFVARRIIQGKRDPKTAEQMAICKATGLDINQLFPVVENKKESA